MEPKLRSFLKQGERAVRLGKNQAAEDVYRQAVAEFPHSAEAWLGLSRAAPSEKERVTCYQRALELDPGLSAALERPSAPATAEAVAVSPPAAAASETPSSQLDAVLAESSKWLDQVATSSAPAVAAPEPVSVLILS